MQKIRIEKPFTIAALIAALVASLFALDWFWGLLLIYFAIRMLAQKEAFLIETIYQQEHPVLFWMISLLWFLWGLSVLVADLWPSTYYAITNY